MLPSNFYKKLSDKISSLDDNKKLEIFDKQGIELLKKISKSCGEMEKFLIVSDEKERIKSQQFIREFNLSVYYKRTHYTIFLTNFDKKIFTRPKDDRYRFLQRLYPNCKEFKDLEKYRDNFFKNMLK